MTVRAGSEPSPAAVFMVFAFESPESRRCRRPLTVVDPRAMAGSRQCNTNPRRERKEGPYG